VRLPGGWDRCTSPSLRAHVWYPVLRHVAKAVAALERTSAADIDPQLRVEAVARIIQSWVDVLFRPAPRCDLRWAPLLLTSSAARAARRSDLEAIPSFGKTRWKWEPTVRWESNSRSPTSRLVASQGRCKVPMPAWHPSR
jgi:hypothetical protein